MQVTEVYARGRPTPQKLTDFQIIDLDDTDEIEVRPSDQGPLPRPLWRGNVAASATLGAMKETERGRRTAGPGQFVLHTFQEVGEGPALTGAGKAAVLAALEHAFSIWEDRVVLKRNLNVRFMWDYRLANRGALGAASPECMVGTAQIDGVQQSYPITFIQQMVDPTVTCNNERANHLRIRVNAGRDDWYFGTDGNTVRQFDLATVRDLLLGCFLGFSLLVSLRFTLACIAHTNTVCMHGTATGTCCQKHACRMYFQFFLPPSTLLTAFPRVYVSLLNMLPVF